MADQDSGIEPRRVLVVDDDQGLREVVTAVLEDEGYQVTSLDHVSDDAIRAAIGRIEPDCILLDGAQAIEFAESWTTAADVRQRQRPIPTVMFTAHTRDAAEAVAGTSERAIEAGFAAVITKPFNIDELLATIERAVGIGAPFNHSQRAEEARTAELVARLVEAGAADVRASTRREWANFRNSAGTQMQLYWSQSEGAYLVARYSAAIGRLEVVGLFYDLSAAINAATA
jgi:two-component system nitrogen regulation response regulator NtrX